MAKRKSLRNEAIDYLKTAAGATIFWGGVSIALNRYTDTQVDWMLPFIVGPVTPILYRVLDGFKLPQSPSISVNVAHAKPARGILSSATSWSVGGFGQQRKAPTNTRTIRYDEPLSEVYEWTVQLPHRHEPVTVDETDLYAIIQAASRRQRSGESHPLSRNYFTRKYRPPFRAAEYEAAIMVMRVCGLIRNRSGGTSGKLAYPRQIAFAVEYAKRYYTAPH